MKFNKIIKLLTMSLISIFSFNIVNNAYVNASNSKIVKKEIRRALGHKTWSTKLYYVNKSSYHKMDPAVYYQRYTFNSSYFPVTSYSIVTKFFDANKKEDNQANYSGDPGFKKTTYKKIGHKFYKIKVKSAYGNPYITYIKEKSKNKIAIKFKGNKYVKGYHYFYAN